MNQPLVAAVSGIFFGSVLCASAYLYVTHRPHHSCCHRRAAYVASVPPPVVSAPEPTAPEPVAPPASQVETPTDCAQRNETFILAQTFYVNGEYPQAIRVAKLCTRQSPIRAYRIIGAAACSQRDVVMAKVAYRHLDAVGRQYLAYVCDRNGIEAELLAKPLP